MIVLLEGSPISTEERWSSVRVIIRFSITSQTKALVPQLLILAGQPALARVLMVPNFLHLAVMETTVLYTLPQNCASIQSSEVHRQFLWSSEFTTGGFQSSCRNISSMISGNRMQLSSILSIIVKGVNTYVYMIFYGFFFILNTFAKKSTQYFSFCHHGVLCVMRKSHTTQIIHLTSSFNCQVKHKMIIL